MQAIKAHAGPGLAANTVIRIFNGLSENQKQELAEFPAFAVSVPGSRGQAYQTSVTGL